MAAAATSSSLSVGRLTTIAHHRHVLVKEIPSGVTNDCHKALRAEPELVQQPALVHAPAFTPHGMLQDTIACMMIRSIPAAYAERGGLKREYPPEVDPECLHYRNGSRYALLLGERRRRSQVHGDDLIDA
jgi:hypothetical protein